VFGRRGKQNAAAVAQGAQSAEGEA